MGRPSSGDAVQERLYLPGSGAAAEAIAYRLIRRRRRSVGFRLDERGLVVTAPAWVPRRQIEAMLEQKADWISRKLQEVRGWRAANGLRQPYFQDEGMLPFRGRLLRLALRPDAAFARMKPPQGSGGPCVLELPLAAGSSEERIRTCALKWIKSEAGRVISERFAFMQGFAPRRARALKFSSAQTLWGTCRSDGTIRLNWKLIYLSNDLIDYVAAHELAHLVEMNHSRAFWEQVKAIKPNYEQSRRELARVRLRQLPS